MARPDGWSGLFAKAFANSRNPMALVDDERVYVDVNGAHVRLTGYRREALVGRRLYDFVAGGPLLSPAKWAMALKAGDFTGEADLLCADGTNAAVQWAAGTEIVTGRRLVLFVALSTSRWGPHHPAWRPRRHDQASCRDGSVRSCTTSRKAAVAPRSRPSSRSPTTPCARTFATPWGRSARDRGRSSLPGRSVTGTCWAETGSPNCGIENAAVGDHPRTSWPFRDVLTVLASR
jgi:PAS domain S-box-containing protein